MKMVTKTNDYVFLVQYDNKLFLQFYYHSIVKKATFHYLQFKPVLIMRDLTENRRISPKDNPVWVIKK